MIILWLNFGENPRQLIFSRNERVKIVLYLLAQQKKKGNLWDGLEESLVILEQIFRAGPNFNFSPFVADSMP